MKLAEALNLRADISKRISALSERLKLNAKVQEGDKPAENPGELLAELENLTGELESLISHINLTNSITTCDGKTLTELIARKDTLTLKAGILRTFLNEASSKVERYSSKEIKITSTVDVAKLRKTADELSEEIRRLNVKIQELNWTTEMAEL